MYNKCRDKAGGGTELKVLYLLNGHVLLVNSGRLLSKPIISSVRRTERIIRFTSKTLFLVVFHTKLIFKEMKTNSMVFVKIVDFIYVF